MLETGNLYCFDYAIKNLPTDNPIIEIGSFCGLSTNCIIHYLNLYKKNNPFFNCDKWIFEGTQNKEYLEDTDISHAEFSKFIKSQYRRNIDFSSKTRKPYYN